MCSLLPRGESVLTMILSALVGLSATCVICAELVERRCVVYLCKPLAMLWVILIALLPPHSGAISYRALLVAGLLCSLGGDILLMLPKDRFLAGLGAFLGAHLFYIAAFVTQAGGLGPWQLILPLALILALVTRWLWPHLGVLRLAVLAYEVVILAMAWRAWVAWAALGTGCALGAAIGAILFVASDLMLAYNRFVRPLRGAPMWILGAYFAAQWLLALSA